MIGSPAAERLAWLERAASDGLVHTVRVSWGDRLGTWRGKRVPVGAFLESPERRIGFCDGMLVVDVLCEIIQETPFSNFETGYPDMYVRPVLETLKPAGWSVGEAFAIGDPSDHVGEPIGVAPRVVLGRLLNRLDERGITVRARVVLGGRLMRDPRQPVILAEDGVGADEEPPGVLRAAAEGLAASGIAAHWIGIGSDPGSFRLGLGELDALGCADAALVAKGALKEVALARGLNAAFITLVPGARSPSRLELHLLLQGDDIPAVESTELTARLEDVRALLQPSVTAFKAGSVPAPRVSRDDGSLRIDRISATAEADPVTALAAALAAVGACGDHDVEAQGEASDLGQAAERMRRSAWAGESLGLDFIQNAVPLLKREEALFREGVTDWELERYWRLG